MKITSDRPMAKIEIDGRTLEVEPGTMVIQAADKAGIQEEDIITQFDGKAVPVTRDAELGFFRQMGYGMPIDSQQTGGLSIDRHRIEREKLYDKQAQVQKTLEKAEFSPRMTPRCWNLWYRRARVSMAVPPTRCA